MPYRDSVRPRLGSSRALRSRQRRSSDQHWQRGRGRTHRLREAGGALGVSFCQVLTVRLRRARVVIIGRAGLWDPADYYDTGTSECLTVRSLRLAACAMTGHGPVVWPQEDSGLVPQHHLSSPPHSTQLRPTALRSNMDAGCGSPHQCQPAERTKQQGDMFRQGGTRGMALLT